MSVLFAIIVLILCALIITNTKDTATKVLAGLSGIVVLTTAIIRALLP